LIRSEVFLSSVAGKHRYFPRLARRVFYFHSLAGLEGFPDGGLDSYEFFLCATAQQKRQITDRRRSLGLSTEGVLNGGYPRYDAIAARISSETSPAKSRETLVYAPTYSGLFPTEVLGRTETGKLIIAEAVASGYYVVFRPHPLSLEHGNDALIEWFMAQLDQGSFVGKIDVSVDYFQTYQDSDIMVTDLSGSSVVFGAVFRKPVIFYGASKEQLDSMIEGWSSVGRWAGDRNLLREFLRKPSWEADSEFKILEAGIGVATYVKEIERISKNNRPSIDAKIESFRLSPWKEVSEPNHQTCRMRKS
jgi:CDP-glycerol glycerophosphotransferase (TagB/SpsB family)